MRGSGGVWVVTATVGALLVGVLVPAVTALAGQQAARPASAPAAFAHPGVVVSRVQLDLVKAKVAAGAQPWKSAFDQMRTSRFASLTRRPAPRAIVECGSASRPNHGCTDEREDALAAYTDALMWNLTGDARYAAKAVELMDAWSATLKNHTNSNAPLQSGWAGAGWSRAAELIRYTYDGWPAARVDRFATMLRTVYLPVVSKGAPRFNGNWELVMTDAAMGIAVFLNDSASFATALDTWRKRVPAYMYLTSDGPQPVAPAGTNMTHAQLVSYWQGQSTFVDGLAQETCRDFGHTGWGFDAAAQAAETARLQGVDLYGEQRTRIVAALEFHAQYDLGKAAPSWLCHGRLNRGLGPIMEIAYNHYHNRLGAAMPNTQQLIDRKRPLGTDAHFVAWETLTFADNP